MAYIINKTNGSILVQLSNGTIDKTSTSLSLIGKNYTGYGEQQGENFVHLLENAANNIAPLNALVGQLWFNTDNNTLNVRTTDNVFEPLLISNINEPTTPVNGTQWFDSVNNVLKIYNNNAWLVIGPTDQIDISTKVSISGDTMTGDLIIANTISDSTIKLIDDATLNYTFLQENNAGNSARIVTTDNTLTEVDVISFSHIDGTANFPQAPSSSQTPTDISHLTRKDYVDDRDNRIIDGGGF